MWIDRFFFWDAVFPIIVTLVFSGFLCVCAWNGRKRSTAGTNRRLYYNIGFLFWSITFAAIALLFFADMWGIAGMEIFSVNVGNKLSGLLVFLIAVDLIWMGCWPIVAVLRSTDSR